mgnify:CR=1 FL=1
MNFQGLLIKTKYFPVVINHSIPRLSSYVMDYADYMSILLQKSGYFRYRRLVSCIVGQKDPIQLIAFIQSAEQDSIYFCNEMKIGISEKVLKDIKQNPINYALVSIECFN